MFILNSGVNRREISRICLHEMDDLSKIDLIESFERRLRAIFTCQGNAKNRMPLYCLSQGGQNETPDIAVDECRCSLGESIHASNLHIGVELD